MRFATFYLWGLVCLAGPLSGELRAATNVISVGYINMSLVPGFTLLSNPLLEPNPTVRAVFSKVQGTLPDGLTVFYLSGSGYHAAAYNAETQMVEPPEAAAEPMPPGRGFWFYNPSSNLVTVTFAGQILQGTLTQEIPQGFSLVASQVPRQATPANLDFPAAQGDRIYLFDAPTQRYSVHLFDELEGGWYPPPRAISPGEAFVSHKSRGAVWTQIFFVN